MITVIPIGDFFARIHKQQLQSRTKNAHTSSSRPGHQQAHNHNKRRYGGSQPVSSQPPPFLIAHKDKDPLRIIMGLLNVINTDNYSKIFQKLRLLVDYSNLERVIHAILEKCCIATIFVTVYIKLIEDIGTLYKLSNIVTIWASQSTAKILYTPVVVSSVSPASASATSASDQYDEFCKMQKHKLHVAGLNTTMIKLAKAPLIPLEVLKSYKEFIMKNINGDEHNLDTCLNCLIELKKAYKEIVTKRDLNHVSTLIDLNKVPHRIRFLVQELIPN